MYVYIYYFIYISLVNISHSPIAVDPFALQPAVMSSGSGRERTSQGKRSSTSQTSSEVESPISAQAKKQRGEGQGSASTDDERSHSGEHINQCYRQNYSNTFTLKNNLKVQLST